MFERSYRTPNLSGFISTSKRSNFEKCTKSAQSTGPERKEAFGEKPDDTAGPRYRAQIGNDCAYWA